MDLLEIKQIKKYFGGICALDDISFSVKRNEIFGIVGPNGAGKTTIFNLATGAYSISNGSIVFDGKIINGMRADQIIDLGVARTFQNIRLFKKLNAVDKNGKLLWQLFEESFGSVGTSNSAMSPDGKVLYVTSVSSYL